MLYNVTKSYMEVTMSRKNNNNKRSTNNTGKRISEHNSYRRPQNQQEKMHLPKDNGNPPNKK